MHALRGVSLDIRKGEFISIIGPSGSGKTTLMDILGCLSRPTSGEYYFEGKDVSSLSDDTLAELRNERIGFVFQAFNLLPRLTALKNVELPLIYGGVPSRERIRRATEALEIRRPGGSHPSPAKRPLRRRDSTGRRGKVPGEPALPHPGGRADGQPRQQVRAGSYRRLQRTPPEREHACHDHA